MALYILGRRDKVFEQNNFFLTSPRLHWHARANTHSTAHPIHHTIIPALPYLNSPRRIWCLSNDPMFPLQKMFVKLTRFQLVSWCFMHFTVSSCFFLSSSACCSRFCLRSSASTAGAGTSSLAVAALTAGGAAASSASSMAAIRSCAACEKPLRHQQKHQHQESSWPININQLLQYECQYIGRWHIIWEYFLVAPSWCVLLIWACRGVQHSAAAVKSPVAAVKMHLALCSPTAPLLMRMPLVSAFSLAPSALLAPWVDLNNAPWVAHLDRTHFRVGHPKKQYII